MQIHWFLTGTSRRAFILPTANRESSVVLNTPEVTLGSEAVNLKVSVERNRSHDHWVLWIVGPEGIGGIQFWVSLLFWLVAGVFLGRIPGLLFRRGD